MKTHSSPVLSTTFLSAFLNLWARERGSERPCHLVVADADADVWWVRHNASSVLSFQPLYLRPENVTSVNRLKNRLSLDSWCVIALVKADRDQESFQGLSATLASVEETVKVVNWRRTLLLTCNKTTLDEVTLPHHSVFGLFVDGERVVLRRNCSHCPSEQRDVRSIWSQGEGFSSDFECCSGLSELNGRKFNVSTFGMIPYVYTQVTEEGLSISGVDSDIMRIIANNLQFEYSLQVGGGWYYVDGNGTKRGVIGAVANGEALMAFGHISMSYARNQVVTYTLPPYFTRLSYAVNVPKQRSPLLNAVIPFDLAVWMSIVATVLAVALAYATAWSTYKNIEREIYPIEIADPQSDLDFLLLTVGTLLLQPHVPWFAHLPKFSSGGTVVMITWSLCGFLLTLAYSSNLLASLIPVDYERPTDTFRDVLEMAQSGGEVWHPRGSSVILAMRTSPNPDQRKIAAMVDEADTFFPAATGDFPYFVYDKMLETGKGAIITIEGMFTVESKRILKRYGKLYFRIIKDTVLVGPSAFAMPKHCSFAGDVNQVIGRLQQAGIIDHLFNRRVSASDKASLVHAGKGERDQDEDSSITLAMVAGPLALLGLLLAVSSLVLTAEVTVAGRL